MEVFESLPPIVTLLLGFVLVAWLVLVFLVPFMIEGIRQSVRKTHDELIETNEKLDRLNALMAQAVGRSAAARRAESPPERPATPQKQAPRGRREPTISEPEVRSGGGPRNRREPIVR